MCVVSRLYYLFLFICFLVCAYMCVLFFSVWRSSLRLSSIDCIHLLSRTYRTVSTSSRIITNKHKSLLLCVEQNLLTVFLTPRRASINAALQGFLYQKLDTPRSHAQEEEPSTPKFTPRQNFAIPNPTQMGSYTQGREFAAVQGEAHLVPPAQQGKNPSVPTQGGIFLPHGPAPIATPLSSQRVYRPAPASSLQRVTSPRQPPPRADRFSAVSNGDISSSERLLPRLRADDGVITCASCFATILTSAANQMGCCPLCQVCLFRRLAIQAGAGVSIPISMEWHEVSICVCLCVSACVLKLFICGCVHVCALACIFRVMAIRALYFQPF